MVFEDWECEQAATSPPGAERETGARWPENLTFFNHAASIPLASILNGGEGRGEEELRRSVGSLAGTTHGWPGCLFDNLPWFRWHKAMIVFFPCGLHATGSPLQSIPD